MPISSTPLSERVKALREALESEKLLCKHKSAELVRKEQEMQKVKEDAALLQARIEEEEEFIANNLLRRLEVAQREKAHLALQVENEEDFLTNTLQKRLEKVRQEKVDLESHLEMEQEYIVNKLQKQLSEVIRQKNSLQAKLGEGHSGLISQLERSLDQYKESLQPQMDDVQRQSILHLETQIRTTQEQQQKIDCEAEEYRVKCNDLEKRLEEVKQDHFITQAKAHRFKEKLHQLQLQREAELLRSEFSDEWTFNRVRRSRDGTLVALRSRSASEVTRKSLCGPRPPVELNDGRARSQSVTLNARSWGRFGRHQHSFAMTPPVDSPQALDLLNRVSSRTDLRNHTEELLQISPCVSHNSPRPRYMGPLARTISVAHRTTSNSSHQS